MFSGYVRAFAAVLALSLASGGCVVLSSRYDEKSREADSLRDAVAMTSREKASIVSRNEALQRDLEEERRRTASLAATLRDREASNRKANEDLAAARKSYEGTRITREQLVTELMEKEKATGKRIQELCTRQLQCDAEAEKLRREAAAREEELVDLRKKAQTPPPDQALRQERDILLGRVERLAEERRREEKRRNDGFEALAAGLGNGASGVKAAILGASLLVVIPERLTGSAGKDGLAEDAAAIVLQVGRTAAAFPASSVIINAGSRKAAAAIKSVLTGNAGMPEARIAANVRGDERGAELILVIP